MTRGGTTRVEVRLMGPVEALVAGRVVPLGPQLQRATLAVLALAAGRTVPVSSLLDALWSDEAPQTATKSVQKYVSQLRKAIGSPTIRTIGDGYRLDIEPECVDAWSFAQSLAEIRDERSASARFAQLTDLLGSIKGEPLADVEAPFVVLERTRLTELQLTAMDERLAAAMALDRHDLVVAEAGVLVGQYPFREDFWHSLILALYRQGRQAEALAAYQRLSAVLADELGIGPNPRLRNLELRILAQGAELGPIGSPPAKGLEERRWLSLVAVVGYDDSVSTEHLHRLMEETAVRTGARLVPAAEMAVVAFGLPTRDDDPVRAAMTAVDLVERQPLRCVVSTGELIVRDSEPHLIVPDDVLEKLRRELGRADPGVVLTDEATLAAAGPALSAQRDVQGRLTLDDVEPPRSRPAEADVFVGRDRELDELVELWRTVEASGSAHELLLLGEAGVGKSSLVARVNEAVGPSTRWLQTSCLPVADGPVGPIARLLCSRFGDDPGPSIDVLLATRSVGPTEQRWLRNAASVPLVLEGSDAITSDEMLRACARLLALGFHPGGGVVVVEDVQWAGATLHDFLAELIQNAETPLLIIRTARPELLSHLPDRQARWPTSVRPLQPLTESSSEELAVHLLPGGTPGGTAPLIAARSEGNPFFVRELVRAVVDQRSLEQLPDSVRSALVIRIDVVTPLARSVLQAAATIGAPTTAALIAAALDVAEASAADGIAELRSQRLVRTDSERWGEQRVAHQLIADVALELISPQRSFDMHRRLAVALGADGQVPFLERLERVAFHAAKAGRLAAELDQPDARHLRLQRGLASLELGRALVGVDASRSNDVIAEALRCLAPGSHDWAEATLEAGRVATDLGRWERAEIYLDNAIDAFRRLGEPAGAARAYLALDDRRMLRGDGPVGEETARVVELMADRPGPELAAALSRQVAMEAIVGGGIDRALELAVEAEPIVAAFGALEDRIRLRHATCIARLERGDDEAFDELSATVQDCIDGGLTRQAVVGYNNLGNQTWLCRRPDLAIPILDRAIAFARHRGHESTAELTAATLGEVLFDAGRWGRALELAEPLMGREDDAGGSQLGDSAAYTVGWIRLWRGDLAGAQYGLSLVRVERARAAGEMQHLVPWLAAAAAACAAGNDWRRGVELIDEMLTLTEDDDRWRCQAIHDAIRLLRRAPEPLPSAQLAQLVPSCPQPVLRVECARIGALAQINGPDLDLEDKLQRLRSARRLWLRYGHRLEAALAAEDEADLLRSIGRRAEAVRATDSAAAQLASLGVGPVARWWRSAASFR